MHPVHVHVMNLQEHAEGVICALRPMQEALDRLTKALLHEERRCRYVSREVSEGCMALGVI